MKVPTPRKLKSGTWFLQMRLNGVSVPVTASSALECKRQATLIKAEHMAGKRTVAPASNLTLKQALNVYINKYEPVLSPSTIRGYTQIRDVRFSAYKDCLIAKIDYQEMINEEVKKVSPKTVTNAWGLVRSSLANVKFPVPEVKLPQVPVKEIPFLQPEEIKPFCEAIKGDIAEIAALLELQGLRRSEALGLDWADIDLEHDTIHIHSAKVKNKDGVFVQKGTTKNKSSTRTVPIMIPQLKEALQSVEDKTGPVVTIVGNTMYLHIREACKRANITVVGNHGLRHSFAASLGYHLGLSVRQLMELGGWNDYKTMQDIYIRVAQADKKTAPEQITAFFKNAK